MQSFAAQYTFKQGVYKGHKMGPFAKKNSACEIEVLEVFEGKGLVVKEGDRIEYLELMEEEEGSPFYSYKSLNKNFWGQPIFEVYSYTDGPAFRKANRLWDCTILSNQDI